MSVEEADHFCAFFLVCALALLFQILAKPASLEKSATSTTSMTRLRPAKAVAVQRKPTCSTRKPEVVGPMKLPK